jgi:hypothetical protein
VLHTVARHRSDPEKLRVFRMIILQLIAECRW